jgi:cysteine desulfurase/selenocysteine lyase
MNFTEIKNQFPIFEAHPRLVYLDSAATTHKPRAVIERIARFYEQENANVHRGIYRLAERATAQFEAAREKVARFIGTGDAREIVFTRGATEAINIVAHGIELSEDDEIVITEMEHHSNLVPWQVRESRIKNQELRIKRLKFIPITDQGELDVSTLPKLITDKTKIVALAYVSNVLGTVNPIKKIVQEVKRLNPKTLVLVDGAQAVGHLPVNVRELGCDFLAFSGHKMCGPTGIGVLWGRGEELEQLEPYQYGGSMISRVEKYHTTWADVPYKFEAGTQNIAGVIGLGAAIDFLESVGMEEIYRHTSALTAYAYEKIVQVPHVRVFGPQSPRLGCVSFTIEGVHAHDAAQVLDEYDIAVRAGHHCAMPLHERLGVPATVRASFYLYNKREDINQLVAGIEEIKRVFN